MQTTNPRIGPSFVFNRYIVCLVLYANKYEILAWFYVARLWALSMAAINQAKKKC